MISTISAQTKKGNWFFSGSTMVSFSSTKTTLELDGFGDDDFTVSQVSFSPGASYFVIDNLAVGLNLSFSSQKTKDDGDDFTESTFVVAPGATYFFGESKTRPYFNASIGYATTSFGDSDIGKFNGLYFSGGAGVAIFLNDHVAVNIGAEYAVLNLSNKEDNNFKTKSGAIGIGGGFSIFL
jgi:outer membrane protein